MMSPFIHRTPRVNDHCVYPSLEAYVQHFFGFAHPGSVEQILTADGGVMWLRYKYSTGLGSYPALMSAKESILIHEGALWRTTMVWTAAEAMVRLECV